MEKEQKQELGWRVSVLPIPAFHHCEPLCCMYTVYSGMQEWVIQIPSIPILVSVLFPSLHLRIKFLLLVYYEVCSRTVMESDLEWLLDSLRDNLYLTPRVIVYCRSLDLCSALYAHFHYELADASYYPPGAVQRSENRLFGMFHSNTPQHNKDVILQSLLRPDGIVRIVFATVALGMGVYLQGVNTIIHYGAPCSIEEYFQESGRGGRSGENASSIIYWKPSDCPVRREPTTPQHEELITVRRYIENTSFCRRQWLLKYFGETECEVMERCCDLCSSRASSE